MKKVIVLLLVAALISLPIPAQAEWCDTRTESCQFAYLGLIPGLPFVAIASAIDGRQTGVNTATAIGYSIFFILAIPYAIMAKIFEKSAGTKIDHPTKRIIIQNTETTTTQDIDQRGG